MFGMNCIVVLCGKLISCASAEKKFIIRHHGEEGHIGIGGKRRGGGSKTYAVKAGGDP